MLNLEIAEKIKGLWPQSTTDQISLAVTLFSDVPDHSIVNVLEKARKASKYHAIPYADIEARLRACGTTGGLHGSYYDCWAVHQVTARFKFCAVLAQSIEGAKVQMEKYIGYYLNLELSAYVLFVGKESQLAMSDYRMKLLGLK